MTIDELRQLADEGDAIDWYGPGSRFTEPLREAADILAARDAEIELLRSQVSSAWAVVQRQHNAGLRDKPEVAMERADLDAAIKGVCDSRDSEIWRILHGWQADVAWRDRLIAENAELNATIETARRDMNTMRSELQAERDRLFAENVELRKDAERYRWLRVRPLYFEEPLSPEELDAHVDAELKHE